MSCTQSSRLTHASPFNFISFFFSARNRKIINNSIHNLFENMEEYIYFEKRLILDKSVMI